MPATCKIGLRTPVFCAGSCFSDHIGQRLAASKFTVISNPFGVIFNPLSLAGLLQAALQNQPLAADRYVQSQGIWYHYDLHSSVADPELPVLKARVGSILKEAGNFLKQAGYLVCTLGTAYVYELAADSQLVANCHKMPGGLFARRMLAPAEIVASLEQVLTLLPPKTRVVFTVSPVRHIKDTLPLNSVSKSVLRLAVHQLVEKHEKASYFPSYELLLDELRDYRFFAPDMLHPSEVAVDYIWQKFSKAFFNDRAQQFLKKWQKLRQALAHRPFHPGTPQHREFLENLLLKLEQVQEADVSAEIAGVKQQLQLQG